MFPYKSATKQWKAEPDYGLAYLGFLIINNNDEIIFPFFAEKEPLPQGMLLRLAQFSKETSLKPEVFRFWFGLVFPMEWTPDNDSAQLESLPVKHHSLCTYPYHMWKLHWAITSVCAALRLTIQCEICVWVSWVVGGWITDSVSSVYYKTPGLRTVTLHKYPLPDSLYLLHWMMLGLSAKWSISFICPI